MIVLPTLCVSVSFSIRAEEQNAATAVTVQGGASLQFDASFIRGVRGQAVDLSRFAYDNRIAPGIYRLDVYINEQWTGRQDIEMTTDENGKLAYCLSGIQIMQWGLAVERLPNPDEFRKRVAEENCMDVAQWIPGATFSADMAELRADITIPQLYTSRPARGFVPSENWDAGINAGFISYNANVFHNDTNNTATQYFVGIQTGLNLAGWRLRHNASYRYLRQADAFSYRHYEAISTYAQRDFVPLKSQLTVGEYFTPNELFDSVPFRGIQLSSDDRMLPESLRGFAPVIRGSADSNAKVTIRQGSQTLYETTVAPGPFEIGDLYSTGYAGDLTVTVTEADGSSKRFSVPYASVAQLLRPGITRYSITAGQYRGDRIDEEPKFVLGTFQRGISSRWTGYAGAIAAEHYLALQGGVALNTSVGAIALDATQSRASGGFGRDDGDKKRGRSYRATYSYLVDSTRTRFSLAAYRFSSKHYLDFIDFAHYRNASADARRFRKRNRLQLTLNQPLGARGGILFFSGSWQNYWEGEKHSDTTYQAGYSHRLGRFNYSLGVGRTRGETGRYDTRYSLTFSTTFGHSRRAPMLNGTLSQSHGNHALRASVSGTAGALNQASYSLFGSQNRFDGQTQNAIGANAQYRGAYASVSGGFSRSRDFRQFNIGINGMVMAHPGGFNLAQANGETMAIVEAKQAQGAAISNNNGARVAGNGYGVVAGLTPYRRNDVSLNPRGMSEDVELQVSSQQTAPRYGAIVMLRYPTVSGTPLLLEVVDEHGRAPPLGADVQDEKGFSITMVGQGGRIFLRGLERRIHWNIVWGTHATQRCELIYDAPEAASVGHGKRAHFEPVEAICRKPPFTQTPGIPTDDKANTAETNP